MSHIELAAFCSALSDELQKEGDLLLERSNHEQSKNTAAAFAACSSAVLSVALAVSRLGQKLLGE